MKANHNTNILLPGRFMMGGAQTKHKLRWYMPASEISTDQYIFGLHNEHVFVECLSYAKCEVI